MNTLIITGWGWKEYAVAAAIALRAVKGQAEVMGMSKRRLPEFLEGCGRKWKRIVLIGISLGGDEARLAEALKSVKAEVIWISSLPMSESQQKNIAPLLKVSQSEGGLFGGELVKQVGKAFKQDVKGVLPFVVEGAKQPKGVPQYHELINAAMYAYRNYRDEESYAKAIRYLAEGIREEAWDPNLRKLVSHYRRYGYREIIGNSVQIKELRERINFVAANPDARVLVLGESGTGKETVALQIHNRSPRKNEPFYAFNCASVNPELLSSRFFGHERGAFTGADKREPGLFELANGGTEEIEVDVRLITATNRNLPARVREGKFREDLFMRLNVIQLRIPPLREHKEDIRAIADNWWFNKFRKHLTDEQSAALMDYDYPGNVRELLNVLERAVVFKTEDFAKLMVEHRQMNAGLQDEVSDSPAAAPDELDVAIRQHVRHVYAKYGENVSKAAAALKITRNTLRKYL